MRTYFVLEVVDKETQLVIQAERLSLTNKQVKQITELVKCQNANPNQKVVRVLIEIPRGYKFT